MKIEIRRRNERVKLASSAINAISLAFFISGIVAPLFEVSEKLQSRAYVWVWILLAILLHFMAQLLLGFLQDEG
ncbi:hypothetical protein [Jiella sonneratiae]|uniref:Uncharacterized protein n=1 Tax=Jiella sonneratiae TaxID=2816856 RepID=A0ABS3J187_9HYPH|nr:hypothetical protein [Jiella sonneratiae]MBO0903450.1 hypothetical protein [Jiella sonneratiae]